MSRVLGRLSPHRLAEAERFVERETGAGDEMSAEPVRLDLGLARQARIAAELLEDAATNARGFQTRAVMQDIMRELMGQHDREAAIAVRALDIGAGDLDIGPVGAG